MNKRKQNKQTHKRRSIYNRLPCYKNKVQNNIQRKYKLEKLVNKQTAETTDL